MLEAGIIKEVVASKGQNFSILKTNFETGYKNQIFNVCDKRSFRHVITTQVPVAIAGTLPDWDVSGGGQNAALLAMLRYAENGQAAIQGSALLKKVNEKLNQDKAKAKPGFISFIDLEKCVDEAFPGEKAKQTEIKKRLAFRKLVYTASPNLSGVKNKKDAMVAFGRQLRSEINRHGIAEVVIPLFSGELYSGGEKGEDVAEWIMDGWFKEEQEKHYPDLQNVYFSDPKFKAGLIQLNSRDLGPPNPPGSTDTSLKGVIAATSKFKGYQISVDGAAEAKKIKGITSEPVLTGLTKRPSNLLLDAVFGKGSTEKPGGDLFKYNDYGKSRKSLSELDGRISLQARDEEKKIHLRSKEKTGFGDFSEKAVFGDANYNISPDEVREIVNSASVYTSPQLPPKFYYEFKKLLDALDFRVLPTPSKFQNIVSLINQNSGFKALFDQASADPAAYGFSNAEEINKLKPLNLYQLGSMVVKTEKLKVLVDDNYKLKARKVADDDNINLISACGIRPDGWPEGRNFQYDDTSKDIIKNMFKTVLIAANSQSSLTNPGLVILPAVGSGVWAGSDDAAGSAAGNFYWGAFFEALQELQTSGGLPNINNIAVNANGKSARVAKIFAQKLSENASNALCKKVVNISENQTDILRLADNYKKANPSQQVFLVNASDPDVTLGQHVGEYVNNLPHHASTTEENYAACTTSLLCDEQITQIMQHQERIFGVGKDSKVSSLTAKAPPDIAAKAQLKVIISTKTLEKIEHYKDELQKHAKKAGVYFEQKLQGKDLSKLSLDDFIELLIQTKKPKIFAEKAVFGDGRDWNQEELSILGDINFAVPVKIFDNGVHQGISIKNYVKPIDGTLLFVPGALLKNESIARGGVPTPDMAEVVKSGTIIDDEALFRLYERRLLPALLHANEDAGEQGAFITIPGIGCGEFAGDFKGKLEVKVQLVLKRILEVHGRKLTNIKGINFDPNETGKIDDGTETIQGIEFTTLAGDYGKKNSQLKHPGEYSSKFQNCKFYSIVAWDHVSWPGNDFYVGSRSTDDGVKAAATNVCEVLTGGVVKGNYDETEHKFQPSGFKNWKEVIERKKLELHTKGCVFVADENYQKNTALEKKNSIDLSKINRNPADDVRKSDDGKFTQATSTNYPNRFSQQDALLVGIVENADAQKDPAKFMSEEITKVVEAHKEYNAGSTLVSALVTNENGKIKITTGYLGDARAAVVVKYRKNGVEERRSILLTEDHEPTLPRIHSHITSKGGLVHEGRVLSSDGSLATGGAVGDKKYPLLRDPDVHSFEVTDFLGKDEELLDLDLVVSCDGLWESDGLSTDQKYEKDNQGNWKQVVMTPPWGTKPTLTHSRNQIKDGENFARHLLETAKTYSADNISVVTASIFKGGKSQVAQGKPVMAIVCDGHGDRSYTFDPQKADGWIVSSSAAAQLAVAAGLQEIKGLEVDRKTEPLLGHFLDQYAKKKTSVAGTTNVTTTWSTVNSKIDILPERVLAVKMVMPVGIKGGCSTIWDTDNRGRTFRALTSVYTSEKEMVDAFSSIMMQAAQDIGLEKDEVSAVFALAKKHGGISNIKTAEGYQDNESAIDSRFIKFSAACQDYARRCGLYTGRAEKDNLVKPIVGCRLTFFPDEALIDFNKKAQVDLDKEDSVQLQKASAKISDISDQVDKTLLNQRGKN